MFKKFVFLIPILVLISMLFLGWRISLAQDVGIPNPLGLTDIFELLDSIMGFIFLFSIPAAIIMLMYAGFMYITSAGNAKNIPAIAKIVQYTLIGFIVVLLAKGIVYVVKDAIVNGSSVKTYPDTGMKVDTMKRTDGSGDAGAGDGSGKWVCNTDGSCRESAEGPFDSQEACISFPCTRIDTGGYSCIGGSCTAVASGGEYGALDLCQVNCKASGSSDLYKCDRSGSIPLCAKTSGSTWDPGMALEACQSSCK